MNQLLKRSSLFKNPSKIYKPSRLVSLIGVSTRLHLGLLSTSLPLISRIMIKIKSLQISPLQAQSSNRVRPINFVSTKEIILQR